MAPYGATVGSAVYLQMYRVRAIKKLKGGLFKGFLYEGGNLLFKEN